MGVLPTRKYSIKAPVKCKNVRICLNGDLSTSTILEWNGFQDDLGNGLEDNLHRNIGHLAIEIIKFDHVQPNLEHVKKCQD